MKRSELGFILKSYVLWFLALLFVLFFSIKVLPLQDNFLGGGKVNYLLNPFFWAWANFDGEHYTSIAKLGYGYGQYPFFPLYPLLIRFFGHLAGSDVADFVRSGILLSHFFLLTALVGLYKLINLDYSKETARKALICLLLFPTSFYLVTVYNESLFLALSVWSFYFARKRWWLAATMLGIAMTATRFVGLIILPSLLVEWVISRKEKKIKISEFPEYLTSIPTGLFAYMYYLEKKTHDMFSFFSNLALFGEQRSDKLIILPQVFYRYIFKIIPSLKTTFWPILFSTFLEFFIGTLYFGLSILSFLKLRLSYAIFVSFGYIIPTFSGSFSSLPRYVMVLFPVYILIAVYLEKRNKLFFVFCVISAILLIVSFSLFARGYWLS
jgi:hypothetical protein